MRVALEPITITLPLAILFILSLVSVVVVHSFLQRFEVAISENGDFFAPRCLRCDGVWRSMAVRDLPSTQLSEEFLPMAAFTCSPLWALTMRRFAQSADRCGAGPRKDAVLGRRSSTRSTRREHAVQFPVAAMLTPFRLPTPP